MTTKAEISTPTAKPVAISTNGDDPSHVMEQYGLARIPFSGTENAFYERHLLFDRAIDLKAAGARERFEAFSRSVRDVMGLEPLVLKISQRIQ